MQCHYCKKDTAVICNFLIGGVVISDMYYCGTSCMLLDVGAISAKIKRSLQCMQRDIRAHMLGQCHDCEPYKKCANCWHSVPKRTMQAHPHLKGMMTCKDCSKCQKCIAEKEKTKTEELMKLRQS